MKYIKWFVLIFGIVLLSGCDEENVVIYKDSDVFTIEIGEDYDYGDFIFAINQDGEKIDCVIDDSEVQYAAVGEYQVRCTVPDEDGDGETDEFTVEVVDTTPPVVSRLETHQTEYPVGSTIDYLEGISYSDNSDGEIDVEIDDSDVLLDQVGIYEVLYVFSDESGNSTSYSIEYTLYSMTPPDLDIEVDHIVEDGFTLYYDITDDNGYVVGVSVALYQGDILISEEVYSTLSEEIVFDDLLSDFEYIVQVDMTYVMNEIVGAQHIVRGKFVETGAFEVPDVTVSNITADLTSITMDITMSNPDDVYFDTYVDVYDGEVFLDSFDVNESGSFTTSGLLSHMEYRFVVHYEYDLFDGEGVIIVEDIHLIETQEAVVPVLVVNEFECSLHNVYFNYVINDPSMVIITSEIYYDIEGYPTSDVMNLDVNATQKIFTDLNNGDLYNYTIEITYDLLDGSGIHTDTYTGEFYTHIVDIASFVSNDLYPTQGETIILSFTLDNPYGIDPVVVTINGHYYTVTEMTPGFYQVSFDTIDLDYGEQTLVLEGIVLNLDIEEIVPIYVFNELVITVIGEPI
jgi:hypothetical protein